MNPVGWAPVDGVVAGGVGVGLGGGGGGGGGGEVTVALGGGSGVGFDGGSFLAIGPTTVALVAGIATLGEPPVEVPPDAGMGLDA